MADGVDANDIHGLIRRVSDMRLSVGMHQGGRGDRTPRTPYVDGSFDSASVDAYTAEVGYETTTEYTTSPTGWPYGESSSTAPSTVFSTDYSSAVSTADSTAPSAQPGHFVGQEEMDDPGPDEPERPLPYEFGCLSGCTAWFELEDWRGWMNHIEKRHLENIYPHHTICWFCDQEFVSAEETRQARKEKFEQRLGHVWRHIWDGEWTWKNMRPDYRFLKHLNRHRLIDKEDFDHAMKYCEGPKRPEFADKSWEPPERVIEKERGQMQQHDIQKEERQRKRDSERQGKKDSERHGKRDSERHGKKDPERHGKKDTRDGGKSRRTK